MVRKSSHISFCLSWILGCLFYTCYLQAQSAQNNKQPASACQELKIHLDSTQQTILSDFIRESQQNHYFINDKGIILMTIGKNEKGLVTWELSPTIDDWFMYDPPGKYFYFRSFLVLVWEGKGIGSGLNSNRDTAAIKSCLWDKIGDRIYIRPPSKPRLMEVVTPDGKKRMIDSRVSVTGGGGAYIITFYKNGTYTKIPLA